MVENCTVEALRSLEPWCSKIYIYDRKLILDYIREEQPRTLYDLNERIVPIDRKKVDNDIVVEFDANKIEEKRMGFLQILPQILENSGQLGTMKYDIFTFYIQSLDTYENENIKCENAIIELTK